MSAERLQKLLARAGITSRRKAEELIAEGRVTINGRVATLGEKADLELESVKLDGKRIRPPEKQRYLLLNKPKGVLTTVSDDKGRPTVIDLIPQGLRTGLFPVGRLDFHTEGLLLLTTDGDFALKITHPRYGCRKIYEVKVKGVPGEAAIERLRRGIVIDGRRTLPAHVEPLRRTARGADEGNSWFEVQLGEGRSRQIREMFFRIGHPVQKLRRVAIGTLRDTSLPIGAMRALEVEEIQALLSAGPTPAPAAKSAAAHPRAGRGRVTPRTGEGRRERPAPRAGRPASGPRKARPSAAEGRRTTGGMEKVTRSARPGPAAGRPARQPSRPAGRPTSRPASRSPRPPATSDRPTRRRPREGGPASGGGGARSARPRNEAPWRRAEGTGRPAPGRPSRTARGASAGTSGSRPPRGGRPGGRPRPGGGPSRPSSGPARGGRPPRPRGGH